MQEDAFSSALQESEDLLWAAQPEQLQEGMRMLACQVAYARRHHECLPVDEINQWIETGRKDRPGGRLSLRVWRRSSRF